MNPELLRWAIVRSRIPEEDIREQFPRLTEWKRGESRPTMRQLESFAKKTMTPFGYFFLPKPPEEALPIPDFRTLGETPIDRPSPDLLDTIQAMEQRQAWMREYLVDLGREPLSFVGRASRRHRVERVASNILRTLGLTEGWASMHGTWEDALSSFRNRIDEVGILVASNGVVGNNSHRRLDPEEFRGFVLIDQYAPLIFVNGADFKAAQMFTLAHELAHVWLGKPALFNLVNMLPDARSEDEQYCNQVAAEFLVPQSLMKERWLHYRSETNPFQDIARECKVSSLVVARRALDMGLISRARFFQFYEDEIRQLADRKQQRKDRGDGGGDFYRTANVRIGKRFGEAIAREVAAGRLLYRDAYRLTGLRGATFEKFANRALGRQES